MCEGGEQLSENETNEKCEGLTRYWGPKWELALGLRKGQTQTHKVENGTYINSISLL